ncbi:MAG: patatin-like phospholipase family protein [Lachnospiraceae bacterium]
MMPVLDLSREYGLVLEGGGAKGAYQIGAWKALREAGLRIRGVSGTSVGSLNGALIVMDDLDKAEYIWENIAYSSVMDISDDVIESVKNWDLKSLNISQIISDGKRVLRDGGIDIAPLKWLIDETVDETLLRESERELFLTTFSVTDRQVLSIDIRDIPDGGIGDMLLASAYFPVFKNEKLGGKRYMDGGSLNNVPIDVLLEHGYQDIIVIRIYGLGFDSERILRIPDDVTIHHIAPRQSLGGILEFDKKKARKNMKLGYFDAMRMLYGLSGRFYYLDAANSESYYFDRMMSEMEFLKEFILEELEITEFEENGYRSYTEELFPKLAKQYRLKEGWDYKELYLAILEHTAKRLRLNRFCIYTPDQLLSNIHRKRNLLDRPISI